ncbi:MAG: esterase-like activity of phytase family protein [Alphaproteobacteria bacterium]
MRFLRHALCAAVLAVTMGVAGMAAADPVTVKTRPVPLDRSEPPSTKVGKLEYRGGIQLESPDKRFGGFSGLWVSPDGQRMLALGDVSDWLSARLVYGSAGELMGVADTEMGRLVGADGYPLPAQTFETDAEALEVLASGGIIVAFERHHRIWLYPPATPLFSLAPRALSVPPGLKDAPSNEGIEAFAELSDGRLLAITEGLREGDAFVGWIGDGKVWQKLTVATHGAYQPTDAKALPNGDVLLLERRYNPLTGVGARLRLIPAGQIVPGGRLTGEELADIAPPLSIDNFEGLGVRRGNGEWLIYIMSDDNFQAIQRTYLMMFALPDAR